MAECECSSLGKVSVMYVSTIQNYFIKNISKVTLLVREIFREYNLGPKKCGYSLTFSELKCFKHLFNPKIRKKGDTKNDYN